LQDPSAFTRIGIFGLKTNHLAALILSFVFILQEKISQAVLHFVEADTKSHQVGHKVKGKPLLQALAACRLQNKRSWVQIQTGFKVFRSLYIAVLLSKTSNALSLPPYIQVGHKVPKR
jgi:hypothetical protein